MNVVIKHPPPFKVSMLCLNPSTKGWKSYIKGRMIQLLHGRQQIKSSPNSTPFSWWWEDNDGAYGNDDKDITGGKEVHGGDTPSDDH